MDALKPSGTVPSHECRRRRRPDRRCRSGRLTARSAVWPVAIVAAGCTVSGGSLGEIGRAISSAAGSRDHNQAGDVTCEEWKIYAAELFDLADANYDGYLDRGEFLELTRDYEMFRPADFVYYDSNSDGAVDRREFIEKPHRMFSVEENERVDCQLVAERVTEARARAEKRRTREVD